MQVVYNMAEEKCLFLSSSPSSQSPAHGWQKVEYLLEFSEWLYQQQFPVQDALDQLQWATDILLKMAEGSNNGTCCFHVLFCNNCTHWCC